MKHRATVWGLSMVNEAQRLLNSKGLWTTTAVMASYSNDGIIKLWDLSEVREIVHARRAVNPGPMCVTVVPSSYRVGRLAICVGGFATIKLLDISHLGSGPSAGAIWAGKTCMDSARWIEWVLDAIAEDSAYYLFAPVSYPLAFLSRLFRSSSCDAHVALVL